ncbi:uncharacterized protein METZ01_LOCUS261675 [marine metagenome]|uniref:Enoyl reductase (ER) domain-containing protein n=1 Tax=marine metagenome TaxID=408172 RepID=A0A382JDL2_9ZZZZ
MGHEGSGVVEKCGPGVTTVKKGDKVVLHWRKGNGVQSETPKYIWNDEPINAGWVTTFNEYAIVSENRVTTIPDESDMKTAPLYGCALTTAFGILHNEAHIKSGESMVIFGVGGVGCALVLVSSLISVYPIVAIDINDSRLEKAMHFGATHTINSEKDDLRKMINKMFPNGVNIVVDTTGLKSIMELSYELTASHGKTVFVGITEAGKKISINSTPLHFGKSLVTSYGGSSNPSNDIPRLIQLQQIGRFNLNEMITHEYSLEKINDAFDYVMNGDGLRCRIKM